MRIKRFRGALLAALTIVLLTAPATSFLYLSQAYVEPTSSNVIVILHTNDLHGHLTPEGNVGGSAYIAKIVEEEREQHPGRVLLLDAGDIIDGDPVGDLFYGRSVIEVMNAMGYDVMTVGNHDLNRYGGNYTFGVFPIENDYLMDLKAAAEFPMLAANVLINGSKPFQSYVIKEIGGVKIGIIGATVYFPPPEGVTIDSNYVNVVRQCVNEIGDQVDLVIALTHLGLSNDRTLAYNVDGIDFIIGGHSHSVLWQPQTIGETKIVQAGSYGRYVGKIILEYDAQNPENYNFSYDLLQVNHPPLEENQTIKEMVQYYDDIISPIVDVKINYTDHALSGSELGEMVAESFKDRAWAEVGYQNSGGIRNYIPAGDIILRQIHKALPYGNKLMSMDLQGSYLKSEFSYGYVAGAYQSESQWYLENGSLIENGKYYRVATNDYTGTRYGFVHGVDITYHGICRDAFIGYIKDFCGPMPLFTHTPFKPHVNETITFDASASIPEWNGTHLSSIVNYTWNFGDSATITETDPKVEHAYIAVGNYTITLNVTDTQGNWNTTTQTIIVNLAEFSPVTLYKVHLDLNHWLSEGANLTATFHTYDGVYQGNTTVWGGATPTWAVLSTDISHPQGKPIEVLNIMLTDDVGSVLQTVTSFVMRRSHFMERLLELDQEWILAPPEELPEIFTEIVAIDLQWPYAPP